MTEEITKRRGNAFSGKEQVRIVDVDRRDVPVIKTEAAAHHYRLVGLEVTAAAGATSGYSLVTLGDAMLTMIVW